MPEQFSEVAESEAEGKVKTIFEDVRVTTGISSVGELFCRLAPYPWFLQLAWTNLKPNASIAYFYRAARDLELVALGHGTQGADPGLEFRARQLMVTGALRAGINGQVPKMNWLSPEDRRIVAPTSIEGDPRITADESVSSTTVSREQQAQSQELRRKAAMFVENLPYRMEISATACRQAGLREEQIEIIRRIIESSWQILPVILVGMGERGSAEGGMAKVGRQAAAAAG